MFYTFPSSFILLRPGFVIFSELFILLETECDSKCKKFTENYKTMSQKYKNSKESIKHWFGPKLRDLAKGQQSWVRDFLDSQHHWFYTFLRVFILFLYFFLYFLYFSGGFSHFATQSAKISLKIINPGLARRGQEGPGGARRSQEGPQGTRGSQERPGGARRSQEEPWGA